MKTWDIKRWESRPASTRGISLSCPCCGSDAEIQVGDTPGATLIAAIGLGLIFDPPGYRPPENFMPDEIRCRTCRKVFTSKEEVSDVR